MELIASVNLMHFCDRREMNQEKQECRKSQKRIRNPENQELSFGFALLSWPRGFQIGCLCPLPAFLVA